MDGFENIPIVNDTVVTSSERFLNIRDPLINRVTEIYGDELLEGEGLTRFDDGEDNFLFALYLRNDIERMLLAKTNEEWDFDEESALIVESRFDENNDDPYKVNFYTLDFSKLNDVDDDHHWSVFFWAQELDKETLKDLLIEKVIGEDLLKALVHDWWRLSPLEARLSS